MSDLRVAVAKAVDTTYAPLVDVGSDLRGHRRTVPGQVARSVEVTVRAYCESAEQAAEWKAAVGQEFRLVATSGPTVTLDLEVAKKLLQFVRMRSNPGDADPLNAQWRYLYRLQEAVGSTDGDG